MQLARTGPDQPEPARPDTLRFVSGAICGVAAVGIWAGWLVMMRLGVTTSLAASDLAALRFGVAGLILLPVVVSRGLALDRLGWPGFLAVAIGGGPPFALATGVGLTFAPAAHAGALGQGMIPLIAAPARRDHLEGADDAHPHDRPRPHRRRRPGRCGHRADALWHADHWPSPVPWLCRPV